MQIFHTVAELRRQVTFWRAAGERVALVPTMGNLHDGHLQLVEAAQSCADRVIVSIFVNPMQFSDTNGNGGDFERYPRTFETDCEKLSAVDAVFSPAVEEVYPNDLDIETRVKVPGISDILCGEYRPDHFVGVATVVVKLFNMAQPDVALFGEKDFQQLQVIRHFVADLCFPIEIIAVPTQREADGLAISSRNQYLSRDERQRAPVLYQTLQYAQQQLIAGERDHSAIRSQVFAQLEAAGFRPEYFDIRRKQDLQHAKKSDAHKELVIVAAAWLGKARLIDNVTVV